MSSCNDHGKNYVGEIGVVITVDCVSDITGDTTKKLKVKKPDGTEVEWDCTIVDSRYLQYVTVAGDFNLPKKYKCQSMIDGPLYGETFEIVIYDEYK